MVTPVKSVCLTCRKFVGDTKADHGEELRSADRIVVAVLSTGQVLVHDQQKTGSSSQSAPAIVHLRNVWQLETVNRQLLAAAGPAATAAVGLFSGVLAKR